MTQINRYAFVIDVSRCIDCRACLAACSVENQVPNEHTRIWVKDPGIQGQFPNLKRTFVPYNCMHCEHPPCIEVCASGATFKDPVSGLVLVDQQACIGCGFCVGACPYGVRYLDEKRGFVDKCNACKQRLDVGLQPACITTCLGTSRMFGDLNDPNSQASIALSRAKTVKTLDIEVREGRDIEPQIYFINGDVQYEGIVPRKGPEYTFSEEGWRKVAIPAVAAGIGLAFAGQAVMFTRQLLHGENEFEDQ